MKITDLTNASSSEMFRQGPYGKPHQQKRNKWPRDGETWEQFYARTAKAMEARQGQDPKGLDGDSHDSAVGNADLPNTPHAPRKGMM